MMYHQTPSELATRVITAIDLCVGECFWRRRFVRMWVEQGIDRAYSDWLAGAPKRIPEFLPQVATLIQEVKQCRFKPWQA